MVLVTGGSGLVGRELIVQLLAKGTRVRAIYNRTPIEGLSHPNLQLVKCDILDVIALEETMEEIEQVYHSAALIAYGPRDVPALFKINVEGTTNVVNAALNAGSKKLLHVSSIAAIGRTVVESQQIDESTEYNPRNGSKYGESKYLAEMEVWRGIAEGLPAVVVNPSLVLGPGNWESGSTRIFKSIYDEFPWYSTGITGFVDVRDVAKAMILLMESEITSQRYILNAVNASFKDVFSLIATTFLKRKPSKKVTPFLAGLIWRWEALKGLFSSKPPLVTRETAETALSVNYFSNKKILDALPGFSFRDINDTITYTCNALQQKLNKQ